MSSVSTSLGSPDSPEMYLLFGEYHHLLQEQCLDDGRFQWYLCLSRAQFEDLLSHVGGRISLRDTHYRRCIPTAERLSTCLWFRFSGIFRFSGKCARGKPEARRLKNFEERD
ncbi:hypothetical protein CRENBAI_000183 [Crenichthys baileyi]|uniref:Uncharacterized protein n=1 Tax=Crenichthys baileyi TaxID=28760 RepID=A0AAV9SS19_9TELE